MFPPAILLLRPLRCHPLSKYFFLEAQNKLMCSCGSVADSSICGAPSPIVRAFYDEELYIREPLCAGQVNHWIPHGGHSHHDTSEHHHHRRAPLQHRFPKTSPRSAVSALYSRCFAHKPRSSTYPSPGIRKVNLDHARVLRISHGTRAVRRRP